MEGTLILLYYGRVMILIVFIQLVKTQNHIGQVTKVYQILSDHKNGTASLVTSPSLRKASGIFADAYAKLATVSSDAPAY